MNNVCILENKITLYIAANKQLTGNILTDIYILRRRNTSHYPLVPREDSRQTAGLSTVRRAVFTSLLHFTRNGFRFTTTHFEVPKISKRFQKTPKINFACSHKWDLSKWCTMRKLLVTSALRMRIATNADVIILRAQTKFVNFVWRDPFRKWRD